MPFPSAPESWPPKCIYFIKDHLFLLLFDVLHTQMEILFLINGYEPQFGTKMMTSIFTVPSCAAHRFKRTTTSIFFLKQTKLKIFFLNNLQVNHNVDRLGKWSVM